MFCFVFIIFFAKDAGTEIVINMKMLMELILCDKTNWDHKKDSNFYLRKNYFKNQFVVQRIEYPSVFSLVSDSGKKKRTRSKQGDLQC